MGSSVINNVPDTHWFKETVKESVAKLDLPGWIMQMTEEDQIAIVSKILQRKRAELNLQHAEAQYGESLFLIRRTQLARESARRYRGHADEELKHAADETVKKYLNLCNISAGALHERTSSTSSSGTGSQDASSSTTDPQNHLNTSTKTVSGG